MAMDPHTRLLTAAAREHLRPLGLVQKGRSPKWLDDHGWFVTGVEFQPSGWSKGSYLNVGAHFLWQWGGFFSYDLGYRVEGFASYESDAQFAPEADRLAASAAREVELLRRRLPDPSAVARVITLPPRGHGWPYYHYAVSLGLSGKARRAARTFREIAEAADDDRDWALVVQEQCSRFAGLVKDPPAFREAIDELIADQRAALKLPALGRVLSG